MTLRLITLLVAMLWTASAAAQQPEPLPPSAAPTARAGTLVGLPVYGARDQLFGHVSEVIIGADGAPAQVLVRPRGLRPSGSKPLPIAVLQMHGQRLSTPITRAEFEALPAAETPAE